MTSTGGHRLAESTSRDLTIGEVLDLVGDANEFCDIPLGCGPSAGLAELRQVIAKGLGVADDWVVTTSGSALGLFLVAMELCRAGDRAIVARPSFPPTRDALKGSGAELVEVPLAFSGGYWLDLSRVAAAPSPNTTLVSIASPQNPSGVRI